MNLTIHRGADEIGGSCVELGTDSTRIVIDIGMPPVDTGRERFDAREVDGKTLDELVALKVLPDLPGLYRGQERKFDALLLSHARADHYALLAFVHPDIPVYMSRGTEELVRLSGIFSPVRAGGFNARIVNTRRPFDAGDMRVTPYAVDHSAFDALAFLIEAGGRKVFYSGDCRGHGRKSELFRRMLADPPRDVDCLLMEGTVIGGPERPYACEDAVMSRIEDVLMKAGPVTFLCVSPQNIDRLVSAYRACRRAKAVFVIDLCTAYLLDRLRKVAKSLPAFDWQGIRVFFDPDQADRVANKVSKQLLYHYNGMKITSLEMNRGAEKYLVILRDRPSWRRFVGDLPAARGAKVVYSMWHGYLDDQLRDFCAVQGMEIEEVHAGGNASVEDLQAFAKALNPRILVPIHTSGPEKYQDLFANVRAAGDGERIEV